MTAQDITTILGGVAALATAVGLPTYLKMRSKSLTPSSVAQMFRDERDRLQKRLDDQAAAHTAELAAMEARHAKALADAEAAWQAQHEIDQSQIKQLKDQIDGLYVRLYQPPPQR